ncbi:MAG: bifunctional riboflavin kinase/FAD synthetase [Gammaproteobacteria bacterium]|nr:bifunctional riboflavin kinase/FAD synthetase [Gammaproteobacteria bacterium]
MEVIRGIHNLTEKHQECVVSIGNFDGLHLGHQALLETLVAKGRELHLPTLVIIFEPQPNEFFSQHENVPRLMRFREKVEAFQAQGIDRVLCIHFEEQTALQVAEVFVRTVLVEKLAVKYVAVGDDFRFGFKRMGDCSLLEALGQRYHFKTQCMETFEMSGSRVSSTRVRQLLKVGDMATVRTLLGRPYSMRGKIAHGDKRGRLLGCPTANIHLHRKVVPVSGVFAVNMLGIDAMPLPGVANVGMRPTISGETRTLLEVHLLNFDRDIYGKNVEIEFLQKFREEKKFANFEELKEQIQKDIEQAREYHQQEKREP